MSTIPVELKVKFDDEFRRATVKPKTYPADKAVRMPLTVQRGYVVLHDGSIAAATLGREHVEVVLAAIRLAVPLVEALLAELLAALSTEKVLGVPRLLQGGHAFLKAKFA